MPANTKIKTACPVCGAKYKVNAATVGHSAKCGRCKTKFRVAEYASTRKGPPTEEDILNWLNEEPDDADVPAPPRTRVDRPPLPLEGEPAIQPAADPDGDAVAPSRLDRHLSKPADSLQFRKTG